MTPSISTLQPTALWRWFETICSIPHPSKHEEALAQHIVSWAKSRNLEVERDAVGNVLIRKPATAGMENRQGVVLQAHIDMVPQKNEDVKHDFTTDPIQPYIDGEWVKARGTTLGADNGMGMASCLAVLEADNIPHGPLEVLLTIDEEAGMTGAKNLQANWLQGKILLNTDSEQHGEIYMGCAGGIDGVMKFPLHRQALPQGWKCAHIVLKGLRGGHSGVNIHHGRGNANKLLARWLGTLHGNTEFLLIDFHGGTLRNAIPREGSIKIAFPSSAHATLHNALKAYEQILRLELGRVEDALFMQWHDIAADAPQAFTADTTAQVIHLLECAPHGVVRMSDDVKGVVETSLNLGIVETQTQHLQLSFLIRSLTDTGRQSVQQQLLALAKLAHADIEFDGGYPGWKPEPKSPIMHIFRDMYESIYGNKPDIMVIHAGLECGLFKEPYPEMDMISFGPTIQFPHSPDERVEIATVPLFWQQLCGILAHIPAK